MPASTITLTLSANGETANLADGTNYQLQDEGWSPPPIRRRKALVGGVGAYESAQTTITVSVYGADTATILDNLAKLTRIVDYASAWADQPVGTDPVTLNVQPRWSVHAAPLTYIITAAEPLDVPTAYLQDASIDGLGISDVQLTLTLRGVYGATATAASSSGTVPAVYSATFSESVDLPSPVQWTISGWDSPQYVLPRGLIAFARNAQHLMVSQASAALGGSYSSSVTDTTNYALGTVMRFNPPANGTFYLVADLSMASLSTTAQYLAVYLTVRRNDSSEWQIRVRSGLDDTESVSGPAEVAITAAAGNVDMLYLGTVSFSNGPAAPWKLWIDGKRTSGSGTLDWNTASLVALTNETRILGTFDTKYQAVATSGVLIGNNAWHEAIEDQVTAYYNTASRPIIVTGRADTQTIGSGAALLINTLSPAPYTQYWRPLRADGTAAISVSVNFTRTTQYLMPE